MKKPSKLVFSSPFASWFGICIVSGLLIWGFSFLHPQEVQAQTDPVFTQGDSQQQDFGSFNGTGKEPRVDSLANFIIQSGLLTNISDIRLDGVSISLSGNILAMHNLRVASDSTTLEDYLQVNFLFDGDSLRLVPLTLNITENVGLYNFKEVLFAKDVTTSLVMQHPNGSQLVANQLHSITAEATDTFSMTLESGTILTMYTTSPTDMYRLQIYNPDGSLRENGLYRAGSKWYQIERVILQTGVYRFQFVPQTKSSVTLSFGFTNNNRSTTKDVVSGDKLAGSLTGWGFEYGKFRLNLEAGDLVEVGDPPGDHVWQYLVNSDGAVVSSATGELLVKVPLKGTYYVFVKKRDAGASSSYSLQLTITPDPNRTEYPVLHPVSKQTSQVGQPFSLQLQATNGTTGTLSLASTTVATDTLRFLATGLPPTLSLDETSGLISGTPTFGGLFPIRVTVENSFGIDQRNFLLKIDGDNQVSSNVYLPTIVKNQ